MIRKSIVTCTFLFLISSFTHSLADNRNSFVHWSDIDGDYMDARQQALYSQAEKTETNLVTLWKGSSITVIEGLWVCPYTGTVQNDVSKLDADHIVPLQWAWKHGADKWDDLKRKQFANDQFNIWIVSASANRSKGSRGPDEWLPPNLTFSVTYIKRFIAVCKTYGLVFPEQLYLDIMKEAIVHLKGVKLKRLDELDIK